MPSSQEVITEVFRRWATMGHGRRGRGVLRAASFIVSRVGSQQVGESDKMSARQKAPAGLSTNRQKTCKRILSCAVIP